MHARYVISLLWTVLALPSLRAQFTAEAPDSLPVLHARPLVITATRLAMPPGEAPSRIFTIDRAALDLLQPRTLAEALQRASGAGVSSYGGSGSLQLVSYQGLGPEYTTYFVNGVRVNDMQSGTVDAGRIPVEMVERIEAVPGGMAALHGSGALGAVVNIDMVPATSLFRGSAGTGSFGWKSYGLHCGLAGSGGSLSAGLYSEQAENDFPFNPAEDVVRGPVFRANADSRRTCVVLEGRLQEGLSTFDASGWFVSSNVGVPGPYTGGPQGNARQSDDEWRSMLSWRRIVGASSILHLAASLSRADEKYVDPQIVIDGRSLASAYRNDQAALNAAFEQSVTESFRCIAGVEAMAARLRSEDVDGTPGRFLISGYLSAEQTLLRSETDTARAVRIFPVLRYEAASDRDPGKRYSLFSPSLGFNFALLPATLHIRGKIGRNVRIPTFNQLFWKQGGNPDLQPERSLSAEAGFLLAAPDLRADLDAGFFFHDVRDKIVWMPGSGIYWSPKNIQHVSTAGVGMRLRWTLIPEMLQLESNGQWISARKMNSSFAGDLTEGKFLPYVPAVSGNIMLFFTAGRFGLSITEEISGKRYTDEVNSESRTLPGYGLTGLAGHVRIVDDPATIQLHLQAGNLFNANYQAVANYPLPGRWFRASVSVKYQ